MAHPDDDTLALLALGEQPDDRTAAHLARCARCTREVEALAATARIGRAAMADDRLATPDPRVWTAIAAELGIPAERSSAPTGAGAPRRRRPRRLVVAGIAALAAAAAIVAGLALLPRTAPPTVQATATLRAFPAWADAAGTAVLEESASGARVLHVRLSRVSVHDGDAIELWLMDPHDARLISLGDVSDSGGDVTIPRGVDLSTYSTVDVSAEPPDGNPAHSGNSIVRGPLREN
jgi:hypothetical protein